MAGSRDRKLLGEAKAKATTLAKEFKLSEGMEEWTKLEFETEEARKIAKSSIEAWERALKFQAYFRGKRGTLQL